LTLRGHWVNNNSMVDDAHCSMLIAHRLDSVVVSHVVRYICTLFGNSYYFFVGYRMFLLTQIKHKKGKNWYVAEQNLMSSALALAFFFCVF
jgi:hypothetical protein